jgi:hypothetical protein
VGPISWSTRRKTTKSSFSGAELCVAPAEMSGLLYLFWKLLNRIIRMGGEDIDSSYRDRTC